MHLDEVIHTATEAYPDAVLTSKEAEETKETEQTNQKVSATQENEEGENPEVIIPIQAQGPIE